MKKTRLIKKSGLVVDISELQIVDNDNSNIYTETFYVQFKEFKCDLISIESNKILIGYSSHTDMNGIFGFKFNPQYNTYTLWIDIGDCIKVYCRRRVVKGDFELKYQQNYYNIDQIKEAII